MSIDGPQILRQFLADKSELTRVAYSGDLEDFRSRIGAKSTPEAIQWLFGHGHASAQLLLARYRARMLDSKGGGRPLGPATVNRRLSALRSLGKVMRTLGIISWALDAENEKAVLRRVRRPRREAIVRIFRHLRSLPHTDSALRDLALFHFLYELGLRRGEICSLDVSHVVGRRILIPATRKRSRQLLLLPAAVKRAIDDWLRVRRGRGSALFVGLNPIHLTKTRKRLCGSAVYAIVKTRAREAGVDWKTIWPYGIRHTAIIEGVAVSAKSGKRLRDPAQFSRRIDPCTLSKYDDRDASLQGELSEALSIPVRAKK